MGAKRTHDGGADLNRDAYSTCCSAGPGAAQNALADSVGSAASFNVTPLSIIPPEDVTSASGIAF